MLFLFVLAFTGTALSALTAADLDPKYFELDPYLTNNSALGDGGASLKVGVPSGPRFSFHFRTSAFLLAGYGLYNGGNNAEGIIDNCIWPKEDATGGKCAKHVVEASSALIAANLAAYAAYGQGDLVTQTAHSTVNYLTGGAAKRSQPGQNCAANDEDVTDSIGVQFDKPKGVKVSCKPGCSIGAVGSHISEILGQAADYIVNSKFQVSQFTVTTPRTDQKRAVLRCGVYYPKGPADTCPDEITGDGCFTHVPSS